MNRRERNKKRGNTERRKREGKKGGVGREK